MSARAKSTDAAVARALVIACDQVGRVIAALHAEDDTSLHEINSDLLDGFLTLWRARWELGIDSDEAAKIMGGAS